MIRGFSHTHMVGAGLPDLGTIPVIPLNRIPQGHGPNQTLDPSTSRPQGFLSAVSCRCCWVQLRHSILSCKRVGRSRFVHGVSRRSTGWRRYCYSFSFCCVMNFTPDCRDYRSAMGWRSSLLVRKQLQFEGGRVPHLRRLDGTCLRLCQHHCRPRQLARLWTDAQHGRLVIAIRWLHLILCRSVPCALRVFRRMERAPYSGIFFVLF